MPHPIETGMPHIGYNADHHEQVEEGEIVSSFLKDPRDWRYGQKSVPINHRPSKQDVKNSQAFAVGRKKKPISSERAASLSLIHI